MPQEIRAVPANAVDHRLLANADRMSPEELSKLIGGIIPPQNIAAHVKSLLKERNWLEDAELDNLITYKLQRALSHLESQYKDLDNMKVQLGFIRELGTRLDKRRAATTVDLDTLYGNNGRLMAQVFDMVLAHMRGALGDLIPLDVWDEAADEALAYAKGEIRKHEAIEA